MIKRLSVLKGVGKFSALNPSSGSEGDFSKFNVIYAKNACGKSTLCDVFRSASMGDPSYVIGRRRIGFLGKQEIIITLDDGKTVRLEDAVWQGRENCPQIHVFDDRFVAENVFIGHHVSVDQRRHLFGLVIGDQAKSLISAVESGTERLNRANKSLDKAKNNLLRFIPVGYTIESFKRLPKIDKIDDQINSGGSELRTAEQTKSKSDSVKVRKSLPPLPIASIPSNYHAVLESTLESAALGALQKILDHLAKTSRGLSINWVKQGHEAKTGDACPHCGQDMNGLEILEAYNSYFSGALQEQVEVREKLETTITQIFGESAQNRLSQILESQKTEQEWWKDAAGYEFVLPEIQDPNSAEDDSERKNLSQEELIHILWETHRSLQDSLDRKKANPGSTIHLLEKEIISLSTWDKISEELQVYNSQVEKINTDIDEFKRTAQSIDLTHLQRNLTRLRATKKRHEDEAVKAFVVYDKAVKEKNDAQKAKRDANEALREQSNEMFERYGVRINQLLKLFGVEFQVVSKGVDFVGMQPSGTLAVELQGTIISSSIESAQDPSQTSLANTLSSGDRSALALAYFLARVESDPIIAETIVVFDDPYTRQDRSRRQVTIERIHHMVDISGQCFVLSHDLEFARTVESKPETKARTFELMPLTDPVILEGHALPLRPSQAFQKNYLLLINYLDSPGKHLKHLKGIADTLRVILEEYLTFKFPTRWGEKDALGNMIGMIRKAEKEDPLVHCQSLVEELSRINTYSQRFHHRAVGEDADDPDPSELTTFVRRTLNVIYAGGRIIE